VFQKEGFTETKKKVSLRQKYMYKYLRDAEPQTLLFLTVIPIIPHAKMPSMKKRNTSATPITFSLPDRSVRRTRRATKPKLSGPISIPFPPPPPPPKCPTLAKFAAVDETYRQILDAINAAKTITNRAEKDAERQRIVDMLNKEAVKRGLPLYVVSASTQDSLPGSLDHN
jgi:hypothetical protein